MTTLSQYQIVGRYMSGTEVTAYHVAKVGEKSATRLDRDVVAYLAAKGQIVNCKGQLYKGKLILKGVGCRLDQLPSKQEAKKENTSNPVSNTANVTKDKELPPMTVQGKSADILQRYKNGAAKQRMSKGARMTVVASICDIDGNRDQHSLPNHFGYLMESPTDVSAIYDPEKVGEVVNVNGHWYWAWVKESHPKVSLKYAANNFLASNLALSIEGDVCVTNNIPLIVLSDIIGETDAARLYSAKCKLPADLIAQCVARLGTLRKSGGHKGNSGTSISNADGIDPGNVSIAGSSKPYIKLIARLECNKHNMNVPIQMGWIVYDGRKRDGKVVGYRHINGTRKEYDMLDKLIKNNKVINPNLYGVPVIQLENYLALKNVNYGNVDESFIRLSKAQIAEILSNPNRPGLPREA